MKKLCTLLVSSLLLLGCTSSQYRRETPEYMAQLEVIKAKRKAERDARRDENGYLWFEWTDRGGGKTRPRASSNYEGIEEALRALRESDDLSRQYDY